jgi:hypothetical protein
VVVLVLVDDQVELDGVNATTVVVLVVLDFVKAKVLLVVVDAQGLARVLVEDRGRT